ncbi:FAD-binding oxidoreductase [Vreelandella titanicae]|uniref:FAD-binding oxidoreductase n=1 Tax=Vreelandella titanicae TaxID=664683 RepID=UPI00137286FB|nr:FAD-binding oxidoreductase [Halomonas titanicae]NAO98910.1 FAD-binding protein [Halomonas sp. MG34]NVE93059.1 FAD-binding oxidoreductase [Halomonas titanicae]
MSELRNAEIDVIHGNADEVLAALQNELGVSEVLLGDAISDKYLKDWSGERGLMPLALLLPRSTNEVSKALAVCHSHQWPVVPQGGLTGLAGGAVPSESAVVISLERMCGVEEVDSASATITLLAGTPLQAAQEAAQEAGFFFALDLGARGSCQVGGNIATNAGGNRVIRYGMARDLVLGLEVVLADGTVLPMLNKMVKNNAGPDLKGLFIGTEGTMGIITRAVLRLHAEVTGANTALIALPDFDAVVKLLRYAQKRLSGLVSAYEVMWADYYQSAITVDGIRAPLAADYPVYVLMDMQSAEPEENTERFYTVLEHAMEEGWVLDAVIAQSHSDAEDFWALRDSIAEMLNSYAPTINFDVSFPISKIGECVERLRRVMVDEFPDIHAMYFGHVGDGNLHIVVGPLPDDNQQTERALEDAFYDITRDLGGSVSAEHGIGTHKKPYLAHSRNRAEINLIKRMKQALDPQGILNPGKIID